MNKIAIEDIATVFISEFAKMFPDYFRYEKGLMSDDRRRAFLKLNYMRRRKLVEKVLDKMI